ncbi:FAD-dependent monooxygenase [Streptomyces sp. ME19-01-6]|uniref:FAD-dependent monooxygenase n=1 Tax=Streptomyces sp. ME19-01-6 TaxID=3028686 RepID=UPI00299FE0A4|nr:FAD-dependent monooxygenase [Streptomyces sp. ME19-01-6]MDX3226097.1 FAD-dependent monooxygenase [Streptomyces sp. ME19-01-6]
MRDTKRRQSVLISGAGIGGPALAYWLDRYGYDVTVVEQATGPRPGGQAVDVRGPALEVAERMGVLDRIRGLSTDLRGMSVVDDEGRELFRTTERTVSGGDLDSPDVEILRDDLAAIVADAGGTGIEYVFGDSIDRLEQDADEVRVVFRGGTKRRFDLVVGADGLHSRTRRLAFGPEEDHLHHLGTSLAVWTAPNYLGLDRWQVVYRMGGTLWGGMVMSVRDNQEVRVYAGFDWDEPPAETHADDPREQKRLVAREFAKARWEMPRLLEHMWDAPDFLFDSMAQIRMDSWSRGRVTLLGDAGYCGSPMSGQGTSMALVGAYVLAGELKAADGDHEAAFAAYERELRGYVTANQELALINKAAMEARDAMDLGEVEGEEFAADLRADLDVTNSYALKDY